MSTLRYFGVCPPSLRANLTQFLPDAITPFCRIYPHPDDILRILSNEEGQSYFLFLHATSFPSKEDLQAFLANIQAANPHQESLRVLFYEDMDVRRLMLHQTHLYPQLLTYSLESSGQDIQRSLEALLQPLLAASAAPSEPEEGNIFELLTEQLPLPVVVLNTKGKIAYFNTCARSFFGLSKELQPEEIEKLEADFETVLQLETASSLAFGKAGHFLLNSKRLHDDATLTSLCSTHPLFSGTQKSKGIALVFEDASAWQQVASWMQVRRGERNLLSMTLRATKKLLDPPPSGYISSLQRTLSSGDGIGACPISQLIHEAIEMLDPVAPPSLSLNVSDAPRDISVQGSTEHILDLLLHCLFLGLDRCDQHGQMDIRVLPSEPGIGVQVIFSFHSSKDHSEHIPGLSHDCLAAYQDPQSSDPLHAQLQQDLFSPTDLPLAVLAEKAKALRFRLDFRKGKTNDFGIRLCMPPTQAVRAPEGDSDEG